MCVCKSVCDCVCARTPAPIVRAGAYVCLLMTTSGELQAFPIMHHLIMPDVCVCTCVFEFEGVFVCVDTRVRTRVY